MLIDRLTDDCSNQPFGTVINQWIDCNCDCKLSIDGSNRSIEINQSIDGSTRTIAIDQFNDDWN
jgi:hypothetical protein